MSSVLLDVAVEELERDSRSSADDEDDVLLSPLLVSETLADGVSQVTLVGGSESSTTRDFNEQAGVVSESDAADGGIGVSDDEAVSVGVLSPFPGLLRYS